jgi:hypothetical protein
MAITRTVPNIYAPWVASAALSRRVRRVVAYPPLSEMSDLQRREFHEALLDADSTICPGSGRRRSSRRNRTGRTCGSSWSASPSGGSDDLGERAGTARHYRAVLYRR